MFDTNSIIINANSATIHIKTITKNLEDSIETGNNLTSLCNKNSNSCLNNKKMSESNEIHRNIEMLSAEANLIEAANYLIQLFYRTNQQYSCSQTKIGKLLSIAAFVCARQNRQLLNESIYKYDGCGTTIYELRFVIDRDVYIRSSYSDQETIIKDEALVPLDDVRLSIPIKYLKTASLSKDVMTIIEDVFKHFGAYSAYSIGKQLNVLVNYPNVTKINDEIDLNRINELKYSDFSNANYLIHYLFSAFNSTKSEQ